MAFTPADPAKAEVKVTQNGDQLGFDFYIPRGAKGEPGGWISTAVPVNTDLNLYINEGLYRVSSSPTAGEAAAFNLPFNESGTLAVTLSQTGTIQIQTYTTNTKSVYVRRRFNSVWGTWRHFGTSRVDQTAGRAMYQWDEVNNREQLIYGNTGLREITTQLAGGTGQLWVQREGNTVHLHGRSVTGADTALGIRMLMNASQMQGCYPAVTIRGAAYAFDNTWKVIEVLSNGEIRIYSSDVVQASLNFTLSYNTPSVWPTTLPGTPVGSIPNL